MAGVLNAFGLLRSPVKHEAGPVDSVTPQPADITASEPESIAPANERIPETQVTTSTLGKRKRETGVYNYTIKVVSKSGEHFDIHEGLLSKHSTTFRELTANGDAGIASGIFNMREHDDKTVHLMKEWLYYGHLPADIAVPISTKSSTTKDNGDDSAPSDNDDDSASNDNDDDSAISDNASQTSSGSADNDMEDCTVSHYATATTKANKSFVTLTKLCILAEEYDMKQLRREASIALVKRLGLHRHADEEGVPLDALLYVYKHASPDSQVFDILVQFTALVLTWNDYEFIADRLTDDPLQRLLFARVGMSQDNAKDWDWHEIAVKNYFIDR